MTDMQAAIVHTIAQRLADPTHRRIGEALWGWGADKVKPLPDDGAQCGVCDGLIKKLKKSPAELWFDEHDCFAHHECLREIHNDWG